MMTWLQPESTIKDAETSPVKAPFSSQYRSWAAILIELPSSVFETADSAVKVGATITSTSLVPSTNSRSCETRSTASLIVLLSFQLPAIMGVLNFNFIVFGPTSDSNYRLEDFGC